MFLLDGKAEELFEGDIIQTPRLRGTVKEMKDVERHGFRAFDASNGGQWPGGVVPYTFAYGFRKFSILYICTFPRCLFHYLKLVYNNIPSFLKQILKTNPYQLRKI